MQLPSASRLLNKLKTIASTLLAGMRAGEFLFFAVITLIA
jgi:hypothetical protein